MKWKKVSTKKERRMFCQTLRIIHEPDSNQNFVDHIGSFDQIVSF